MTRLFLVLAPLSLLFSFLAARKATPAAPERRFSSQSEAERLIKRPEAALRNKCVDGPQRHARSTQVSVVFLGERRSGGRPLPVRAAPAHLPE